MDCVHSCPTPSVRGKPVRHGAAALPSPHRIPKTRLGSYRDFDGSSRLTHVHCFDKGYVRNVRRVSQRRSHPHPLRSLATARSSFGQHPGLDPLSLPTGLDPPALHLFKRILRLKSWRQLHALFHGHLAHGHLAHGHLAHGHPVHVYAMLLRLPGLLAAEPLLTQEAAVAFQATYQDLLRAVQMQVYLYPPDQLCDLMLATGQLPPPSSWWCSTWCLASARSLGQLNLTQELLPVAGVLLNHQHNPGRVWGAAFMARVQDHLAQDCSLEELALVCRAISQWALPLNPKVEAQLLQGMHRTLPVVSDPAHLLSFITGLVVLQLRPGGSWKQLLLSTSCGMLDWCSPEQVGALMQGLQLLGVQPDRPWVSKLTRVLEEDLDEWEVEPLAEALMAVARLQQQVDVALLDRVAEHVLQLSEGCSAADHAYLLAALVSLGYTPSDDWLDQVLDAALIKLQALAGTTAAGAQGAPGSSSSSTMGSEGGSSSNSSSEATGNLRGLIDPSAAASVASLEEQLSLSMDGSSSSSSIGPELWEALPPEASHSVRSTPPLDSSNSSLTSYFGTSSSGNDSDTGGGQAQVLSDEAAAALDVIITATVLDLLTACCQLKLQLDSGWMADCLGCLVGHFGGVRRAELQQLLLLIMRLEARPDPEWVDQLLQQCSVEYQELDPGQQVLVMKLLVSSQCRPGAVWWSSFLSQMEAKLPQYSIGELCLSIKLLSDMGGRPPQTWLKAHEQQTLHKVNTLEHSHWLTLALSYSRLMYQPCQDWVAALEQVNSGGLLLLLTPAQRAGLLGAAGRLQLPVSAQWEAQLVRAVVRGVPSMDGEDLGEVIQGFLSMDIQVSLTELASLMDACSHHLSALSPAAACGLLRLMALHGHTPPKALLQQMLAVLQPQLQQVDAPSVLQLLQSLKQFRHQPDSGFMGPLDLRLQQLLPRLDATGISTVLEDLLKLGAEPSHELQAVVAESPCMKKGLARASQGIGPSLVWAVLDSVMAFKRPPHPLLLDVLLPQVQEQMVLLPDADKAVVLPQLMAAVASWEHYSFSVAFLSDLCAASLSSIGWVEDPRTLVKVMLRCSHLGLHPPLPWVEAVGQQVVAEGGWPGVPAGLLCECMCAWAELHQVPDYLLEWPMGLLTRCQAISSELDGEQVVQVVQGLAGLDLEPSASLLHTLEERSGEFMEKFSPDQLAVVTSSLFHLGHQPSPRWVQGCVKAAQRGTSGLTAPEAAALLYCVGSWAARPDAELVHGLLQHMHQGLREVPGGALLRVVEVLAGLGFRLGGEALGMDVSRAAMAAARATCDREVVVRCRVLLGQLTGC